jgi:uncharacterized membrane protein YsdA (DUF1294 family)
MGAWAFVLDKRRARRGVRRLSEKSLHLLELAGGWPGTLAAGHLIRHKTLDRRYRLVRALIVAAHVALWTLAGLLIVRSG